MRGVGGGHVRTMTICISAFAAGKSLATKYGCKYIETSPGINHNVDELLVGMLAQIELRREAAAKAERGGGAGGGPGRQAKVLGAKVRAISQRSRSSRHLSSLFQVMDLLFDRVMRMQGAGSKAKSCGNLHVL